MKQYRIPLFSLVVLMSMRASFALYAQEPVYTVLKGQVYDRKDTPLLLTKFEEDVRHQHQVIPVSGGKFEYAFRGTALTAYQLAFEDEVERGYFKSIDFFLDQDTIFFTIYPEERFDENGVAGGRLNEDIAAFNAAFSRRFESPYREIGRKLDSLQGINAYYSEEFNAFMRQMPKENGEERLKWFRERDSLKAAGKELTPLAGQLREEMKKLSAEAMHWRYDHVQRNPSEAYFYLMLEDITFKKEDKEVVQRIAETYPDYAASYPEHPYTALVGDALKGVLGIAVGGNIIDFVAPDLEGTAYQLSELLTGKVVLIDFWGSWCGPCIAKTRTMMPVYMAYREKGFNVVGVAREFKSTDALRKRLETEKYPWINLVELDDKQGIWNQYGMSNAAGMMLLVDGKGTILAVNPEADQVRQILEKSL